MLVSQACLVLRRYGSTAKRKSNTMPRKSMLTYRYRIKDATSGKHLTRMAWAVHRVWNYCNEVSLLAWRREKRFLSAFDLINLTAGAGHELGLHTDTISEVCQEYARRKKIAKKIRLKWRSQKRSLGWIPFKG